MRYLLILLLLWCPFAFAGTTVNPESGGLDVIPTITEEDGSPAGYQCEILKFANGNVTDNGDGTCSIGDQDSGGATAYDDIGDPDAAGSISFDNDETATYSSAEDTGTFMHLTLTDDDLGGATTILKLSHADNDDANGIFLQCYDDSAGDNDRVFQIGNGGQLTIGEGANDYTLPTADGNANEVLASNGAGAVSFQSLSALGGGDITDVWDCSSGDCNTPVVEAGENLTFSDSTDLIFGTGEDAVIQWDETQDVDSLQIGVATANDEYSGVVSIMEKADLGAELRAPHQLMYVPSFRVYSPDENEEYEYVEIYHNNTDGYLRALSGDLNIIAAGDDIKFGDDNLTTTGIVTGGTVNVTGLTASELVATDASKNLQSLAVATYPSLTELSYVKGLSSAVQTQINGKQGTLTNSAGLAAALDDETGTGLAVFNDTPTLVTPEIGAATGTSLTLVGTDQSTFTEGLVVNDGGGADADDDLRVETDSEDNFLVVDASENYMTVGDYDTNYWKITSAGIMTPTGTATIAVPSGAAVADPDAAGKIAVDTTTDQLLYYGGAQRVMTYRYTTCRTLETPTDDDDNIPVWAFPQPITITDVHCWTEGGTSIAVTISDGTNALEAVTCDADGADDDGSIANGTFTANENIEWDFAAPTGEVDWVKVCITYTIDAD